MEFEPAKEQDQLAPARSGTDRHKKAQEQYEKHQRELAEILDSVRGYKNSPRSWYNLAKDRVYKRKNSQLTQLFKSTVQPPAGLVKPKQKVTAPAEELASKFEKLTTTPEKKPVMAEETLAKMMATIQDLSSRMQHLEGYNQQLEAELKQVKEKDQQQ